MVPVQAESIFVRGAVSPQFIADCIASLGDNSRTGAHDIFLGQVRADIIEGNEVVAIDYSAYEEMAQKQFEKIRTAAFEKFELTSLQVFHSIGMVRTGEICLFVLASSAHRKTAFEALRFVVEEIKKEVPVFGKELFEDDTYQWKVNN